MTVRLLLARHGDTFNPGDRVVFVGSRNDLPLTERGRAQADAVGKALVGKTLGKFAFFCGPLQRTRIFAEIASQHLHPRPSVAVDARLNELDYGLWAGLTTEEVRSRWGEAELCGWDTRSIWPQNAGWPENEQQITAEVLSLVAELKSSGLDSALLVSSNGRLRYLLKAIPGAFEQYTASGQAKVRTGNLCMLELSSNGGGRILSWNTPPEQLTLT